MQQALLGVQVEGKAITWADVAAEDSRESRAEPSGADLLDASAWRRRSRHDQPAGRAALPYWDACPVSSQERASRHRLLAANPRRLTCLHGCWRHIAHQHLAAARGNVCSDRISEYLHTQRRLPSAGSVQIPVHQGIILDLCVCISNLENLQSFIAYQLLTRGSKSIASSLLAWPCFSPFENQLAWPCKILLLLPRSDTIVRAFSTVKHLFCCLPDFCPDLPCEII